MSFMQIQEGSTGIILPVYLQDSSGAGLGGVAHTAVTSFYKRQGAAAVAITEVAGTEGAWSSGGWVAAASLAAGNYELHVPDAAFAAGAGWVLIEVGATGARTERFLIELGPFEVTLPVNMGILAIDANGRVDLGAINGSVAAAQNLEVGARTMVPVAVTTQVTTTQFIDTNLPAISQVGKVVGFVTGPAAGQSRRVTAHDTGTGQITVDSAFAAAPAVGNTGIIM